MNKKEARKILKNDYSKFLELPADIRNDNSIKDLALQEAMRQQEDEYYWQYFLLEREERTNLFDENKEFYTSNNDKYMIIKIAEVTKHNVVYMQALSDKLRNDKEFFKELYRVRPKNFSWGYLEYGSKKIKSDFDLALIAIDKNIGDFEHIDSSLLKNLEFLAKSLNINPALISKYEYSEEVLRNAEFIKHLNKKNKGLIKNYLTSNKFSKDPFDNEDSLEEEQGKIFLLYVICWFFFSEYQNDAEPFKLTPEIKEKASFFIKRCGLEKIPLLKNVSPIFFKVNEKNEVIEHALEFTNKGILPSALILQLPKVAIFKAFHIGIELLTLSSFINDNKLTYYQRIKEDTLRKLKGFENFLNFDDINSGRWRKEVAMLCLSQLASYASIYPADGEEDKSIHYYCTYILNLIRNKFQSNQFVYSTKYEENFDVSAAFPEEKEISLTSLHGIIKLDDSSLVKYQKINQHFEAAIQTFIEKTNVNKSLLNKITNFLIEDYGLVINYQSNQILGGHKEMLRFFSFESNSDINVDFLKFIQKDKKWLCGINSEYFKIPSEPLDDADFEEKHKSAKFDVDGYQPINPKNLSNGYLVRVNAMDFWKELHIDVALPVDDKKINKDKEFIFLDEMESMKRVMGLGSFFMDTMKKVNEGGSVSITQSESTILKKGELYTKNLDQKSENIRLLEESLELNYSINLCLPSEILYHLKEDDDVEEIATYKFGPDLFSIDENMWSYIIKIIILKYKSGSCEGLAIPFYQR